MFLGEMTYGGANDLFSPQQHRKEEVRDTTRRAGRARPPRPEEAEAKDLLALYLLGATSFSPSKAPPLLHI